MMKAKLLCAIFLIVTTVAHAQQPDSLPASGVWSLKQCIDYALANNLSVKRSTYTVETSEVDLLQSKLSRLPSVNGNVSYGYSWGRGLDPVSNLFVTQQIGSSNFGANSSLPLFNALRIHNTVKQNENTNLALKEDLEKTKNDVMLNVATLFLTVVFNKELVENAKYQLASSQQQFERTRKQVQAGSLAKSEELNLDAQVATNELNLIQQENALALSLLRLKQALQLPASQALDVEIPVINIEDLTIDQTRDEIYEIARQTMPEIKSAELKITSSNHAVKAARGNLYPRLSLNGSLNTNYSSVAETEFYPDGTITFPDDKGPIAFVDKDLTAPVYVPKVNGVYKDTYGFGEQFKDNIYKTVSLQLTIPIFNSYQSRAAFRRSVIQNEQTKINAQEISNTLRQSVETAYNDAFAASKSYNASLRQVSAREEAFRMIKQRYEIGAVNFVEYQVSENDLFRAKSDLLRAKYDFIFKKKVLDFYQGKPLAY